MKDTDNLINNLTATEYLIAKAISEGLTNKEVAENLNKKKSTISRHLNNIYKKLHINNRTALMLVFTSEIKA